MKINVLTYGTHNPHCEAAAVVFAEFVADLQVIIYQNSPEHKNFSNHFEPSIFLFLDLGTFNMADRGSYACIYGGKINGDIIIIIIINQPTNQPTSEYNAIWVWKMDTGQADICNFNEDMTKF